MAMTEKPTDRVLAAIRRLHATWPDGRVGQMLAVVTRGVDLYSIENDALVRLLDAATAESAALNEISQ